jgi:hypothetical protein
VGAWTNLAAGCVADASSGPSLAVLVTHVDVTLDATLNNQTQLQLRVLSTNAIGNDEWIGVDNISITAEQKPTPTVNTSWGKVKTIYR